MKNATMFYIHPGKQKLHGINVNTVIADALDDNVVSDLLAQGYRRSPREALAAYQEAQKPVVNGPTASPPLVIFSATSRAPRQKTNLRPPQCAALAALKR